MQFALANGRAKLPGRRGVENGVVQAMRNATGKGVVMAMILRIELHSYRCFTTLNRTLDTSSESYSTLLDVDRSFNHLNECSFFQRRLFS